MLQMAGENYLTVPDLYTLWHQRAKDAVSEELQPVRSVKTEFEQLC